MFTLPVFQTGSPAAELTAKEQGQWGDWCPPALSLLGRLQG